jgi:hypothetical protein
MKTNQKVDLGRQEQGQAEKHTQKARSEGHRQSSSDVRPELGVLGWRARAQRLFGAVSFTA